MKIQESLEIEYLAQYNVKNIFALGRVTRIELRTTAKTKQPGVWCNLYHMLQLVRFISHSINFSQPKIFVFCFCAQNARFQTTSHCQYLASSCFRVWYRRGRSRSCYGSRGRAAWSRGTSPRATRPTGPTTRSTTRSWWGSSGTEGGSSLSRSRWVHTTYRVIKKTGISKNMAITTLKSIRKGKIGVFWKIQLKCCRIGTKPFKIGGKMA